MWLIRASDTGERPNPFDHSGTVCPRIRRITNRCRGFGFFPWKDVWFRLWRTCWKVLIEHDQCEEWHCRDDCKCLLLGIRTKIGWNDIYSQVIIINFTITTLSTTSSSPRTRSLPFCNGSREKCVMRLHCSWHFSRSGIAMSMGAIVFILQVRRICQCIRTDERWCSQ